MFHACQMYTVTGYCLVPGWMHDGAIGDDEEVAGEADTKLCMFCIALSENYFKHVHTFTAWNLCLGLVPVRLDDGASRLPGRQNIFPISG